MSNVKDVLQTIADYGVTEAFANQAGITSERMSSIVSGQEEPTDQEQSKILDNSSVLVLCNI